MSKKVFFVILIIMLACLMSTVLSSCNKEVELAPLELSYDEDSYLLSWNGFKNVKFYEVKVYEGKEVHKDKILYSRSQEVTSIDVKNQILKEDAGKAIILTITVEYVVPKGYKTSGSLACITLEFDEGEIVDYLPPNFDYDNINRLNVSYFVSGKTGDITYKIENLEKINAISLSMSDYVYVPETSSLTIKKQYFDTFSLGSTIYFSVVADEGNQLYGFYVSVVTKYPHEILPVEGEQLKVNNNLLKIKLIDQETKESISNQDIHKVAINGINLSASDIYYESQNKAMTMHIRKSAFVGLPYGIHQLTIWTKAGKSIADFIYDNQTSDVKNIIPSVSYDVDYYPYVRINWIPKIKNQDLSNVKVVVGDKTYYSKDEENSNKFVNNSFLVDAEEINKVATYKVSFLINEEWMDAPLQNYIAPPTDSRDFLSAVGINRDKEGKFINKFALWGDNHNFYIKNSEELKDLAYYLILHYDNLEVNTEGIISDGKNKVYARKIKYYAPKGSGNDSMKVLTEYLKNFPEAVAYEVAKVQENNVVTLYFTIRSTVKPNINSELGDYSEFAGNDLHYTSTPRTADYEDFKINSITKKASADSSVELMLLLEKGLKPECVPGSSAESVYNSAKQVLRQIISDDMDDYAKVHAIYDWLADNVIYCTELGKLAETLKPGTPEYDRLYFYNTFFSEGVFGNGRAVCNGIAQAYVIMCRIEGIEAYKVLGKVGKINHAWIKVKINNNFYICDATWANKKGSLPALRGNIEYLSHEFLFLYTVKAEDLENGDRWEYDSNQTKKNYAGDYEYNVFANMYIFTENGTRLDYVLNSLGDARLFFETYCKMIQNMKVGEQKLISVYGEQVFLISSSDINIIKTKINIAYQGKNGNIQYFLLTKT